MMDAGVRLVLLPGLGADGRMFESQRAVFPRLEVPAWLPPEADETLASYGRRMAGAIDGGGPLYLGGASFGGMVALEVARHIRSEAVFLIGSCRSGRHVARWTRWFERLTRPVPDGAVECARLVSPLAVALLSQLRRSQREAFLEMFGTIPTRFLRWGLRAIFEWSMRENSGVPIHHIHGDRDLLIPARLAMPDHVIAGAGHLLNATHADEVNQFIQKRMST